jgi:hypothetical protein
MHAARISSTRSLRTIGLTLLIWIAGHSLTPAYADRTPNKEFAGTWRGKTTVRIGRPKSRSLKSNATPLGSSRGVFAARQE